LLQKSRFAAESSGLIGLTLAFEILWSDHAICQYNQTKHRKTAL